MIVAENHERGWKKFRPRFFFVGVEVTRLKSKAIYSETPHVVSYENFHVKNA